MATLEEIVVQLTAETQQLRAELQGASKAVQDSTSKMDAAIKSFENNSTKNLSFFQQSMATMAGFLGSQAVLGAFGLLKDGISFLAGALEEGAQAAIAEEQALTRLGNSLLASGKYSKTAFEDLANFAGAMEELTGVGDDVIASNLAVLSSMTKLDAQGLKAAQKGALDLSAAMGVDLDTATKAVAKAVGGSETALKKMGIEVALTSDKTQNLQNVMAALGGVSGQAEAKMKTFGGAVTGLKNAYGNFVEALANSITKNQVVIAVLSEAGKIISSLTAQIQSSGSSVRDGLGEALLNLLDTLVSLAQAGDYVYRVLKGAFNGLQTALAAVIEGVIFLYAKLTGTEWPNPFEETAKQWDETTAAFTDSNALTFLSDKLGQLRAAGGAAFEEMKGKAMESVPAINAAGGAMAKIAQLSETQKELLKSFAEGLAQQGMDLQNQYTFQEQMLQVSLENQAITQQEYFAQMQQLNQSRYETDQANLALAYQNSLITQQQYNAASLALAQKKAVDDGKLQAAANKEREANLRSSFTTIASLSESGNKELSAIGKAAAITNATIDGYAAVQKALAAAPPPFNFALAALVGAASAANVAKIAGVGLKSGIDSVPGIGNQDNFPAILAPGERVVPSKTNEDLTAFLANQGERGAQTININVTIAPGTGITREQAADIVEGLNAYVASGGLKLVGAT